jgi:GMP synthase (glutamine-hydrolysing)
MSGSLERRKALIILHQVHSSPGRVGRLLQRAGVELDIRRPALGEELPESLAEHQGVVVFGGPMCANDGDPWLRREIEWLAVPLKENKPFLGLCLGAQMLAIKLGARVYSHPDRRGEAGYYAIRPTAAADALCPARFPRNVYQWHFDGFDLPHDAIVLARGDAAFPNQAFRYGAGAFALQFHPEVTYQMMCRWTVRGFERLKRPGARAPHEHLDGWRQHDQAVERWIEAFLPSWILGALPAADYGAAPAAPFAAAAYPEV